MTTAAVGSAKESELRQRAAAAKGTTTSSKSPSQKPDATAAQDSSSLVGSLLTVLRYGLGIAFVSTTASYLMSNGDTLTWGVTNPELWATRASTTAAAAAASASSASLAAEAAAASAWAAATSSVAGAAESVADTVDSKGLLELTNDELAHYDGSDGTPIYLALNRTIYDMSASAAIYGPGGAYSKLAAKDASRSYVTTCFDPVDDLVPYLGGLEELFVPVWLSKTATQKDIDALGAGDTLAGVQTGELIGQIKKRLGKKNVAQLTDEVYEAAHLAVRNKIYQWEDVFKRKGYPIVGKVVGVDEKDPMKWRHLAFCEEALAQRPPMTESMSRALELSGKAGGKLNLKDMGGNGEKPKPRKKKKDIKKEEEAAAAAAAAAGGNGKAEARIEDLKAGGKYGTGKNSKA